MKESTASLPFVFDSAQRNAANSQKCMVMLNNLQKCNTEQFTMEFGSELRRALVVKTSEPCVKRLVKFIVTFAVSTKTPAKLGQQEMEFSLFLLRFALHSTRVKKNEVRYWGCKIIAELLKVLPEDSQCFDAEEPILDDILKVMRDERAFDSKLVKIRIEAIKTLGRLKDPQNPKCPVMPAFLLLLVHDQNMFVSLFIKLNVRFLLIPRILYFYTEKSTSWKILLFLFMVKNVMTCRSVRKAVLQQIAITKKSILPIISRTRDVSTDIRKRAFTILGSKVDITLLTVEQRVQILDAGINDRDEVVRKECIKLIITWLQNQENNPIKLLEFLSVTKYEKVAGDVINILLSSSEVDQNIANDIVTDLIDKINQRKLVDAINDEIILFFRVYLEKQMEYNDDNVQNYMNIEITEYCILIKIQIDVGASDFVLLQLLRLAENLDLSDEAGRRVLSLLLSDLIISPLTTAPMLKQIFILVSKLHPKESNLIDFAVDALNTVFNPLEQFLVEDRISIIEQRLEQLQKEMDEIEASGEPDEERIEEIKNEAEPLEEQCELFDSLQQHVHIRICKILSLLFAASPKSIKDPRIEKYEKVVNDSIGSGIEEVKESGYECLNFYCLESFEKAMSFIPKFIALIKHKKEKLKLKNILISNLFDLALWWGLTGIENKMGNRKLIQLFILLLEFDGDANFRKMIELQDRFEFIYDRYPSSEDSGKVNKEKIRTTVVEGFSKLFLLKRISIEHKYFDDCLFYLIVLYFSPDRLFQYTLTQCLSVFFNSFTITSEEYHLICLKNIFIRCLKFIFESDPESSPAIHQIDPKKLGLFILSLTQPFQLPSSQSDQASTGGIDFSIGSVVKNSNQQTDGSSSRSLFEIRCSTHQQIVKNICLELVNFSEYDSSQIEVFVYLLNNCTLINATFEFLQEVIEIVDKVSGSFTKAIERSLLSFRNVLVKLSEQTDPPTESDEDSELENLPEIASLTLSSPRSSVSSNGSKKSRRKKSQFDPEIELADRLSKLSVSAAHITIENSDEEEEEKFSGKENKENFVSKQRNSTRKRNTRQTTQ